MSAEDVKLPVAAAAAQAGVPERSLFRAVEKGRILSTKRDGVTVVDPADVEAWAARRAAARSAAAPATATAGQTASTAAAMADSLPAAHGGVAVGSGRVPLRPVLDGELTAALIARFKRGETPVDVAEALRLPIPLVMEGHDHFLRVREGWLDTSGPVRPLLVAIFGWVAEQERARLIERTKAGIERARRQGKRLGRPPVSPVLLSAAADLVRAGVSVLAAAREKGVKRSTLRRFLAARGDRAWTGTRCGDQRR